MEGSNTDKSQDGQDPSCRTIIDHVPAGLQEKLLHACALVLIGYGYIAQWLNLQKCAYMYIYAIIEARQREFSHWHLSQGKDPLPTPTITPNKTLLIIFFIFEFPFPKTEIFFFNFYFSPRPYMYRTLLNYVHYADILYAYKLISLLLMLDLDSVSMWLPF